MFQFVFPALLFRFNARAPSMAPLLQLPKRRATAAQKAQAHPPEIFYFLFKFLLLKGSFGGRPPVPLLSCYAATPAGGSRRTAAPMYQPVSPALAYRFNARAPSRAP